MNENNAPFFSLFHSIFVRGPSRQVTGGDRSTNKRHRGVCKDGKDGNAGSDGDGKADSLKETMQQYVAVKKRGDGSSG